jgi:hypothetical protein
MLIIRKTFQLLVIVILAQRTLAFVSKGIVNGTLIIGSAGFIGNHLARFLKKNDVHVLPMDSYEEQSYSVLFKRKRAWDLLLDHKLDVMDKDICTDQILLNRLMSCNAFTHVIYLGLGSAINNRDDHCLEHILRSISKHSYHPGIRPPVLVYTLPTELDCLSESCNFGDFIRVAARFENTTSIGINLPENTTIVGSWPRQDRDNVNKALFGSVDVSEEKILAVNVSFIEEIVHGITTVILNSTFDGPNVVNIGATVHQIRLTTWKDVVNGNLSAMHAMFLANNVLQYFQNVAAWYKRHGNKEIQLPCVSECASRRDCISTGFDKAASMSRNITSGCEIVFFTEGFHREQYTLRVVKHMMTSNCYVAFISKESPLGNSDESMHNGWTLIRTEFSGMENFGVTRRISRIPKISPTLFFSSTVNYCVHFDTRLAPIMAPHDFISLMSVSGKRVAVAMLKHPVNKIRNSMEEIDTILAQKLTSEVTKLEEQRNAYQFAHNYSDGKLHFSIMPTAFMIAYDLKSSHGHKFRCNWLTEYLLWADRDQPPLFYVLAKNAMDENRTNNVREGLVPLNYQEDQIEEIEYFRILLATGKRYLPYFLFGSQNEKGYKLSNNGRNIG